MPVTSFVLVMLVSFFLAIHPLKPHKHEKVFQVIVVKRSPSPTNKLSLALAGFGRKFVDSALNIKSFQKLYAPKESHVRVLIVAAEFKHFAGQIQVISPEFLDRPQSLRNFQKGPDETSS